MRVWDPSLGMTCSVEVDGAAIRYLRAGDSGHPTLVLVHGGGANRSWWYGMIPDLVADHRLLAVDLSGHGDSDHRPFGYSPELWAKEIVGVLDAEGHESATIVGHSMGGFVTTYLCSLWPGRVKRAVLIDSGLREPDSAGATPRGRERKIRNRVYPTKEDALARFRLVPEQPSVNPAMEAVVAEWSLRETDDGWMWKFDPQVFKRFTDVGLKRAVRRVTQPIGLIYGQHSPGCGPVTIAFLQNMLGREVPSRMVAGAYHHVPVDAPESCTAALRSLLSDGLPGGRHAAGGASEGR